MNKYIAKTVFCLTIVLSQGCSTVEIMPIQTARVTQIESYEQTFFFSEARDWPSIRAGEEPLDVQRRVNEQIDAHFRELVGDENWQTIRERYGLARLRDELIQGELKLKGTLVTVLSLDAYDQNAFFLEGTGRFFLVREKTGELLLNGDFLVIPERRDIGSLDAGVIDINILLTISRIPGAITRLHQARVRYAIQVDRSLSENRIYALDYGTSHEVFLLHENTNTPHPPQLIGYLRFDNDVGESKLIDLRGTQFLRQDYGRLPRSQK